MKNLCWIILATLIFNMSIQVFTPKVNATPITEEVLTSSLKNLGIDKDFIAQCVAFHCISNTKAMLGNGGLFDVLANWCEGTVGKGSKRKGSNTNKVVTRNVRLRF